jgi:homoaconitase/3-isopropylmalate dehydratase large subunit
MIFVGSRLVPRWSERGLKTGATLVGTQVAGCHVGSSRNDRVRDLPCEANDEEVNISEANTRRMVSNATTSRETSADHTTRILKKLGFEEEKEGLIMARSMGTESGILPAHSRISAGMQRNERQMTIDKLA